MTEATTSNVNSTQVDDSTPEVKSAPWRKFITLAAMMLIFEAIIVVGAFSFFAGPKQVEATSTNGFLDAANEPQVFTEVLVFDDRLYNDRLGQAFEYRVKIAVKVLEEDREWVAELAARFGHELHMELDTIWRSADPRHLREVDKRTLTSRVSRMLEQWVSSERLITTADDTKVIHEVIVVPSPGIRINR